MREGRVRCWAVDPAARRLGSYFLKLEGGPWLLDGVDPMAPLLAPADGLNKAAATS